MSTMKASDPTTDIILDLISEHESNGNYNAVIGNAKATDDLSRYTLNYVRTSLMQDLLDAGQPSTAVGRYQIIRRTFQALQGALRLPDSARFTPAVQDQMAVQLLVGRGYPAWWREHMTDAEFAHGMSCEWASLPDPERAGQSHYHGVGMNRAGTTLAHVYDALHRARAAIPR